MDKTNTEATQELDNDMDAAFAAAASDLGVEMPMTKKDESDEEGQGLQETEEGRQEEGVLEQEEEDADDDADGDEPDASTAMPQSWGKKDAAVWNGMSKEAKARVKQRETELFQMVNQKVSEAENVISPLKTILREVEPLAKEWRAEGMTREQGLLKAVALYDHIRKSDPLDLAKKFLKASGQGPEALVDTPQSAKDQQIRELQEKVERLESGIGEVEQERQLEPVRQAVNALQNEFAAFSTTKNAFGEDKYPSAKNADFARAMGSLVPRLAREVPDADPKALVLMAYERLGGQIVNGTTKPSSSKKPNTETLKTQARSGFGKGKSFTGQKVKYDNLDDAWAATLAEFDLLE